MPPADLSNPGFAAAEESAGGSLSTKYVDWGLEGVLLLVSRGSELVMIFGGIGPFVPQYLKLRQSGNVEGFSLYVCFVLILANILRVCFWTVRRFETPLLLQSFVMLATMMLIVRVYVNAKRKVSGQSAEPFADIPRTLSASTFWQWPDFATYVYAVVGITGTVGLVTFVFQTSTIFVELLGFLAVLIEACLGLPQFVRNLNNRSTTGMSVIMIGMWTCGDTFKFFYFWLRNAPLQFSICALLQISLDVAILGQVVYYNSSWFLAHGASSGKRSPSAMSVPLVTFAKPISE